MKNNVQENTKVNENIKTEKELEVQPPRNCDVMLLNSAIVSFEAVEDVLSHVLNIPRNRSMQIAMQCHTNGKASVFLGPEDVATQYQRALTEYARQQHTEDTAGMGYDLITFNIEKRDNT